MAADNVQRTTSDQAADGERVRKGEDVRDGVEGRERSMPPVLDPTLEALRRLTPC